MKNQSESSILITGATSGIGAATAQILAPHFSRMILTGRREDRLESIKESIEQANSIAVRILTFDVRDRKATIDAINSLPEDWKTLDVLINNAGLAKGFGSVHKGDFEHWDTMIDTNIKGLLTMTRLLSPYMVKAGKGHIVNVGSIAGKEVYPYGNVYCATKFAVDALSKAMRLDFYQHGIRVSQVSPGHVEETEFALVRFDGDKDKAAIYADFQPLKSIDVARAIEFMINQPPYVNIQDIVLMGTQQASANHIDRSGRKHI